MAENNFGLFFTKRGTVIRLPINPEKLPVVRDNDNQEYNVLGKGPIMVARIPALKIVTISSYFPGRPFSGVLTSGGFEPPEFYIDFFQSAMENKKPIVYTPVRFYEDGEPFATSDTGFKVLVTQFTTEERGGETGDFYFDLELTEYKSYAPQVVMVQPAATPTATTEPARENPPGELVVGAICTCNGPYYCSSYGDEPHGNGNGKRVKVSRIVSDASRAYPIHVDGEAGGPLGWAKKESLTVVG